MALTLLLICVFTLITCVIYLIISNRNFAQEKFIRNYVFRSELFHKVLNKYPHLENKDIYLIAKALRQFFLIHHKNKTRTIGMPSQCVDEMWHEFILDTLEYTRFCNTAFGRYFHHQPASSTFKGQKIATSLRRTFYYACLEDNINPLSPVRLPLLFAIDQKLNIPEANLYHLPENSPLDTSSSSSSCGGTIGDFSSDFDSFSGGDSSSDSSCGGGCGGGGD